MKVQGPRKTAIANAATRKVQGEGASARSEGTQGCFVPFQSWATAFADSDLPHKMIADLNRKKCRQDVEVTVCCVFVAWVPTHKKSTYATSESGEMD